MCKNYLQGLLKWTEGPHLSSHDSVGLWWGWVCSDVADVLEVKGPHEGKDTEEMLKRMNLAHITQQSPSNTGLSNKEVWATLSIFRKNSLVISNSNPCTSVPKPNWIRRAEKRNQFPTLTLENTIWFNREVAILWGVPWYLVVRILDFHCHCPGSVPGWVTEIPQAKWTAKKREKKSVKVLWLCATIGQHITRNNTLRDLYNKIQ